MTRKTFYKILEKLPEEGYEPFLYSNLGLLRIRKKVKMFGLVYSNDFCPITAVHHYKTGRCFSNMTYASAARELFLSEHDPKYQELVQAADNCLSGSVYSTRRALLRRLGLS